MIAAGRAEYVRPWATLEHDVVDKFMDPRDLGIGSEPPELKARRSYEFIAHDPARWRGKGFSPFVEIEAHDRGPLDRG